MPLIPAETGGSLGVQSQPCYNSEFYRVRPCHYKPKQKNIREDYVSRDIFLLKIMNHITKYYTN